MPLRFGLKGKLFALCMVLSSLTVGVASISYFSLAHVEEEYELVAGNSLPNIRLADEMFLSYSKVRIALRTLGISGVTDEDARKALRDVGAAVAENEAAVAKYRAARLEPEEKALIDGVEKAWSDFKSVGIEAMRLYNTGHSEDRRRMIEIFFTECPEQAAIYNRAIDALVSFNQKQAELRVRTARDAGTSANRLALTLVLGSLLVGLGGGYLFAARITKAINVVSHGLLNEAHELAEAADRISVSSQTLSSGAIQQAAALQETSAAIEELNAMVQKNTANAAQSSDVSGGSLVVTSKGKQVVGEMLSSIRDIAASNEEILHQIEESNREISDIVKVISQISDKTKVINDIVFQTKLLSFNASVEAARAGENGRGFAIVAQEVGNLAAMSGGSAKEIADLLEDSMKQVHEIVGRSGARIDSLVAAAKQKIEMGAQTASLCDHSFDEIIHNVGQVDGMVKDISVASSEQAKGIDEINKAMVQLDQLGQTNSSSAGDSSQSADRLREQVKGLRSMIAALNETVNGTRAA